jgi:hypothetical protein
MRRMNMPSFQELLRGSLRGVNATFEEADADLNQAVAEAAEAIQDISGGKVRLALATAREGVDGTVYSLRLSGPDGNDEVLGIKVPVGGYPLVVADHAVWVDDSTKKKDCRTLSNVTELREFFSEIASRTDSSLVVKLAYFLRKGRK